MTSLKASLLRYDKVKVNEFVFMKRIFYASVLISELFFFFRQLSLILMELFSLELKFLILFRKFS